MKRLNIFLVALSLGLIGCSSASKTLRIDGKSVSNKYGKKCGHPNQDIFKISTVDSKVESTKTKEFFEQSKSFRGLESVNLNNTNLKLTLLDKNYFEEYSAPIIETVREAHREARPVLGMAAGVSSLGLGLFLAPENLSEVTFGCTDKELVNSEPDFAKKSKTGKSEWRDVKTSHKIRVSGFDKDYEFSVGANDSKIDLSPAILNTKLTKNTNLTIQCVDCNLLGSEEQSLFPNAKTSIQLSNDFNPVKQFSMEAEKNRLAEEAKKKIELIAREKEQEILVKKRAKEDEIRKALDAKAALEIERKKQELPLDEFKIQCEQLGFKVGTEKFGKCVLDLNETR